MAGLIKVLENQVLYSLSSAALLCDEFIDGLDWPAGKPTLVFRFPEKEARSGKPVRDMVSRRKYVCRLTYMADRRKLPAGEPAGAGSGFKLAPFRNAAEHGKWARTTDRKYFSGPFKAYLTPAFKAEAAEYYKNELPRAKGIAVRKNGKIVAMLTLLEIAGGDSARPLHWISWVWSDPRVPKDGRRVVRSLLLGWLRANTFKFIGASVHAANLRSQKWFLKSGFRPERISFTRRAVNKTGSGARS